MNLLNSLKQQIASALAVEKAYNLPDLCSGLGLAPGDSEEAFASKYKYVLYRVEALTKDEAVTVAKKVLERFSSYRLEETLDLLVPLEGVISAITRRDLINKLSDIGDLNGRLYINEFLQRTFPLSQIPYDDYRFQNLEEAVGQHMIRNYDWSYKDFLEFADYLKLSEHRFRTFLEQIVHPEVRTGDDQKRFVDLINPYLERNGFELCPVEETSGYPVYRIVKKGGVPGHCKNLIFAADGPKPELVLADALNNDIRITKNEEFCLVYDLPIGIEGLQWKELIEWWAVRSPSDDPERSLYKRLHQSLGSGAEKTFFRLYFQILRDPLQERLPAIVPQVYLHYDPYTIRDQPSGSPLARQRMDFLLLLPGRQRVVIEIDGKHHYANGDTADPQRYATMVAEDRNLRLLGYEVYRFGAFELTQGEPRDIVEPFLNRLIKRNL
jgi:very-short-patch-repair endonuclease